MDKIQSAVFLVNIKLQTFIVFKIEFSVPICDSTVFVFFIYVFIAFIVLFQVFIEITFHHIFECLKRKICLVFYRSFCPYESDTNKYYLCYNVLLL